MMSRSATLSTIRILRRIRARAHLSFEKSAVGVAAQPASVTAPPVGMPLVQASMARLQQQRRYRRAHVTDKTLCIAACSSSSVRKGTVACLYLLQGAADDSVEQVLWSKFTDAAPRQRQSYILLTA